MHPTDDQWTLLLRLQSQKLQQQEKQLKQETVLRKLAYKKQLDDHIERTQGRGALEKQRDIKMLRQRQYQDQIFQENLKRKQQQKKRLRKQALDYNSSIIRQKQRYKTQQRESQGRLVTQMLRYQTDILIKQRRSQSQRKDRQKTQLINAYNDQINQQRQKKYNLKYQDQIYSHEFKRIQDLKEKRREDYINKIKYGYKQNPQAYNNYVELQNQNQKQRNSTINRYLTPLQIEQQNIAQMIQPGHNYKKPERDTNNIDRMYNKGYYTPEQNKKIKQVKSQLQMRDILDRQVQQKQMQRVKEKHMNNNEIKLNQQSFQGVMAVPGLSLNDYHKNKQRQILNNSVGLQYRPKYQNYKVI